MSGDQWSKHFPDDNDRMEARRSLSITLNHDCLRMIFDNLYMNEKLKCRLVCRRWKSIIDSMIARQSSLELFAVNSKLAEEIAYATGCRSRSSKFSLAKFSPCFDCVWIQEQRLETIQIQLQHLWNTIEYYFDELCSRLGPYSLRKLSRRNSIVHYDFDDNNDDGYQSDSTANIFSILYESSRQYSFCASSSIFSSYCLSRSLLKALNQCQTFDSLRWKHTKNRLKYSVIISWNQLSLKRFETLLQRFPNLNRLMITNIDHLSDSMFFSISKFCPKIQSLSITNCSASFNVRINDLEALAYRKTHHQDSDSLLMFSSSSMLIIDNQTFSHLSSLTIRRCKLIAKQLTTIIRHCRNLIYLDISDNIEIGQSIRYLGPKIDCLVCGDLSSKESIESILTNLIKGNGINVRLLSICGKLQDAISSIKSLKNLEELEMHFYVDDEFPREYLTEIGSVTLRSLILEQIRCVDCPSVLNHSQFESILQRSQNLKRLQITGDFEWNLRLNDQSLRILSQKCPELKELTLNGNGSITDYGILYLRKLPLAQLNLSSFNSITDYSIGILLERCPGLQSITLIDMPQLTERIVREAITKCRRDPEQNLSLTLDNDGVYQNYSQKKLPRNLKISIENHLCGKQIVDSEPTDFQMFLIILISLLIITMTLLTTVVVLLVPLSMALMMIQERIIQNIMIQINFIMNMFPILEISTSIA
ncbi:hypothetical protein SSS_03416 [Sarcoptes scabiei]|uniref:F-box domain-containing protein n=1 Tax=Sarcoptes scabiei TaxID=52283 RepID=A0A834R2H3_SARSC|nr:hypothetical protein SSS_03416 [Sarcoptes scabiei]